MRHPISLRLLTITLVVLSPVGRSEAAAPLSPHRRCRTLR